MGTTATPVLMDHQWKDDGTNFYRVRITHERKNRYIKSNIVVTRRDVNKAGRIRTAQIQDLLDDLMKRIRKAINDLETFNLKSMTVDEVVEAVQERLKGEEKFQLDFIEYGYKLAGEKSEGNAKTYYVALNALLRFFKGRHPDISEISVKNLYAFAKFIQEEEVVKVDWRSGKLKKLDKKKGGRAASLYLANIRHIYKCAIQEFNEPDKGRTPVSTDLFVYFKMPKAPAAKHKNIPPEVIQRMIDTRYEYEGRQRMAIDAFLISFGLCGINPADMYRCDKPKKNILHYYRQKTEKRRDDHAEMWVKIHPCILRIMKDYEGQDRCFDYSARYVTKDTFITALNQGLALWIKKENIKEDNDQTKEEKNKIDHFTFTSARHTWGTIGSSKKCNIKDSVITAGMCHVDEDRKVDKIYINFDWELLWDAQKTILDVFKW